MSIVIKNAQEIEALRAAGRAAASILDFIEPHVRAGVTTGELDRLCKEHMDELGVVSATIGYAPPGYPPFTGHVCTSVNHVICHGIPGPKALKNGDVLNIDVTVIKDGWYGDTSRMYLVGQPGPLARRLVRTAYEAMCAGILEVRPGATLGDVGHAIESVAQRDGFSVVQEYFGHGIGRKYHESPRVLNFGERGEGLVLEPGMVFTVEPMINAGKRHTRQLADGWTVVTRDRSLSAQWEHMVAVTDNGFRILTPWPDSHAEYPAIV